MDDVILVSAKMNSISSLIKVMGSLVTLSRLKTAFQYLGLVTYHLGLMKIYYNGLQWVRVRGLVF